MKQLHAHRSAWSQASFLGWPWPTLDHRWHPKNPSPFLKQLRGKTLGHLPLLCLPLQSSKWASVFFLPLAFYVCMCAKSLQLFPTLCNPMTVVRQAPLSMGLSRQEYWSGLPCPPPGNLANPGTEPASLTSPALQANCPHSVPLRSGSYFKRWTIYMIWRETRI